VKIQQQWVVTPGKQKQILMGFILCFHTGFLRPAPSARSYVGGNLVGSEKKIQKKKKNEAGGHQ
jgi:hypothetical protein